MNRLAKCIKCGVPLPIMEGNFPENWMCGKCADSKVKLNIPLLLLEQKLEVT